jgi:hypothetical protein
MHFRLRLPVSFRARHLTSTIACNGAALLKEEDSCKSDLHKP